MLKFVKYFCYIFFSYITFFLKITMDAHNSFNSPILKKSTICKLAIWMPKIYIKYETFLPLINY